ncbi:MAG: aspartyl-phosphate phosphatase Spo0E family protein [Negativicutes bacterium]|nr:aspartyl-phosphate phosphatase Spo0E family protein [Negativicutes bacterium]
MQQEIEETRTLLTRLVTANKGDITHPDVAALSAKLDGLIVRYEQMKPEQEKGQKK